MRLPGTFNLRNNELPSAEFLEGYRKLREKQRVARETEDTDGPKSSKTHDPPAKSNDKKIRDNKVKHDCADTTNENKAGPEASKPAEANVTCDAVNDFTEEQDRQLIELKLINTSWRQIATELGKSQAQVKERFRVKKPDDFDKRHMNLTQGNKNENNAPADANNDNEAPDPNAGGGKSKKKGKGKANAKCTDDNAGGINVLPLPSQYWYSEPDEIWTAEDLPIMLAIANSELNKAFKAMSNRFRIESGKRIHPSSIAEKMLGSRPDWEYK